MHSRFDRKPFGQFPPGFGVLFAATVICFIAFPPLGLALIIISLIVWRRRVKLVRRRKEAVRDAVIRRLERETSAALRSFPLP